MNFQNSEKYVPRKFTVEFRGDCVHVWSVTSAGGEIFAQLDAKRPKKKKKGRFVQNMGVLLPVDIFPDFK